MDGLKWVRTPSARDKIRCWVPHPPKSKVSSHTDVSCLERAHYTYHGNKIYFCIFVIIKHIRCLVFGMCKLNSSIIGVNLPINKGHYTYHGNKMVIDLCCTMPYLCSEYIHV
ncbi:hypothetical protein CFC21_080845 [Triticum aestivum]|uniref:Uncharacterized protein n=3 Tax=Triticinae TaxID=1648030 RepID=A0A453MFE0_AEGTS|nr:hypothetical protein CFC21_080845 [Triticum aestivum]